MVVPLNGPLRDYDIRSVICGPNRVISTWLHYTLGDNDLLVKSLKQAWDSSCDSQNVITPEVVYLEGQGRLETALSSQDMLSY